MPTPSKRPPRRMSTSAPVDEDEPTTGAATPAKRAARSVPAPEGADGLRPGWSAGQREFDSSSPYAQALKLGEQGVVIKFLEDQPYASFRRHWVERSGAQGRVTRAYLCMHSLNKDCPLCDVGDKPQTVSAFNIAVLGDDNDVATKTWDVGIRLFKVLESYAKDPKIGPLTKGFFLVNKTGAKQNVQYNVIPVKASSLAEDYDIEPPPQAVFDKADRYDASVIEVPKRKDLDEIAAEIADEYD
jgi:hypothetical protein